MDEKRTLGSIIKHGIIDGNPTFRLVLGTCPTLAVTTSAINGLGMGLSVTFVLLFSNIVISLLRKHIPDDVRIPGFIVVICTFVTIVEMLLKAYFPGINEALGMFIPLIVVNCIILARAESFASKNGVIASAADGIGMGIGFTMALVIIGSIRELIGAGTLFGVRIMTAGYEPMLLIVMSAGGFITFGLILGVFNAIVSRTDKKGGR